MKLISESDISQKCLISAISDVNTEIMIFWISLMRDSVFTVASEQCSDYLIQEIDDVEKDTHNASVHSNHNYQVMTFYWELYIYL